LLLLASRDSGAGMGHPSKDRSRRSCRIQEDQGRRGTRSRDRDTNAVMKRGNGGKPLRSSPEQQLKVAHGSEDFEDRRWIRRLGRSDVAVPAQVIEEADRPELSVRRCCRSSIDRFRLGPGSTRVAAHAEPAVVGGDP
jgi:hypothetical protein